MCFVLWQQSDGSLRVTGCFCPTCLLKIQCYICIKQCTAADMTCIIVEFGIMCATVLRFCLAALQAFDITSEENPSFVGEPLSPFTPTTHTAFTSHIFSA